MQFLISANCSKNERTERNKYEKLEEELQRCIESKSEEGNPFEKGFPSSEPSSIPKLPVCQCIGD